MKAKQLASGSWRVQITLGGQRISITEATEKEALRIARGMIDGFVEQPKKAEDKTLRQLIDDFIQLREPTLSPVTVRTYRGYQKHRLQSLLDLKAKDITADKCQLAINADVPNFSPKSIKSAWGFIDTVLKDRLGKSFSVRLPQLIPHDKSFLQPEQIPVFVDAMKGNRYEIAALLALHGLRVSEVMDVRWSDIRSDCILVHGSAVPDVDGVLTHKQTNKNSTSHREVPIMIPQLLEAVEKADKSTEYVCNWKGSGAIYNGINRVCKKAGLPEVGIHGLRHSWTSLCQYSGVSAKQCQVWGGWSNQQTMMAIYAHLADSRTAEDIDKMRRHFVTD